VSLDVVLTSPLVRARQTADIVAAGFSPRPSIVPVDSLAPGGSFASIMADIEKHARKARVALVGHEPGLGELAARLIGSRHPIEFKKGAVCRIDLDEIPPSGPGHLRWMLTPKILRRLKNSALHSEPVRLPVGDRQLDRFLGLQFPVEDVARERRQLVVSGETQRHKLLRRKARRAHLQVGRQHLFQAQPHLQPDHAVLGGDGHLAGEPGEHHEGQRDDQRERGAPVRRVPNVPASIEEVQEQDRKTK